jgi:hypothetical protein
MTEHQPCEGVAELTKLDEKLKALEEKALLLVRDCFAFEKDEKDDVRYASGTKRWACYSSKSGWMNNILCDIRSDMLHVHSFLHNERNDEENKLWAFDYFLQFLEHNEMETDCCRLEHDEEVKEKILSML